MTIIVTWQSRVTLDSIPNVFASRRHLPGVCFLTCRILLLGFDISTSWARGSLSHLTTGGLTKAAAWLVSQKAPKLPPTTPPPSPGPACNSGQKYASTVHAMHISEYNKSKSHLYMRICGNISALTPQSRGGDQIMIIICSSEFYCGSNI